MRLQMNHLNPMHCAKTAVIALLVLISALPAWAANPPGSYQETCINIGESSSGLVAQCKNRAGQYGGTTLSNYQQCIGDISNNNGQLQCNKGATPPSGSYTQSCSDIRMDNGVLEATCRTLGNRTEPVATRLGNLPACRGDIENFDGNLTCSTGTSNPPPGSYGQTCGMIVVNGTTVSATCITRNQNLRSSSVADFQRCIYGISNTDGLLSCDTGDSIKSGSYQVTCININTSGTKISAQCEAPNGSLRPATLTIPAGGCGDISNQNGALSCGSCELGGNCIH
jgi:hypothetical protein